MTSLKSKARSDQRGAAAVEMALVLPLLVMLAFGIFEFARAYQVKVELTGAVREGARALALGKTVAQARQAVIDAAPGVTDPALSSGNFSGIAECPTDGSDANATITVTYGLPYRIPLYSTGTFALTLKGVMRCGV